MPRIAKNLALVSCAAIVLAGAAPKPPAEQVPAQLVETFADELQQYGHDTWNASDVHLGILLQKIAAAQAASLRAAVYQARAATELRGLQYSSAYYDARRAAKIHRAIGYHRGYIGDLLTAAQAEYHLTGYEPALQDISDAEALLARERDRNARAVGALAALMRGQVSLAFGDRTSAQRSFNTAASSAAGLLYQTAAAYVALAYGETEAAHASYLLVPFAARDRAAAYLAQAESKFARAASLAPQAAAAVPRSTACAIRPGETRICRDLYFYQAIVQQGWDDPKWLLSDTLLARSRALSASGNVTSARTYLDRAMHEGEKVGQANADVDAQIASLQGVLDPRSVAKNLDVHRAFVTQGSLFNSSWPLYYDLARTYEELGMRDEALSAYDDARKRIAATRRGLSLAHREMFLEDHLRVYDDEIHLLLQARDDAKAFSILQERTARQTLGALAQSQLRRLEQRGSPAIAESNDLAERYNSLAWRVDMLGNQGSGTASPSDDLDAMFQSMDTIYARLTRVRDRLKYSPNRYDRAYYEWSSLRSEPGSSLSSIANTVLRPHETMLVYAWLPHEIAIWTISHGMYRGVRVVPRTRALDDDLRLAFINGIDDVRAGGLTPNEAASPQYLPQFEHFSELVYKSLIGGLPIPRNDDLIIVPSGPLYQVAFEALVTGQRTPHCPGDYLICTHAISYAASPEMLAVARRWVASAASRKLLAFARPAIGGSIKPVRGITHVAVKGCDGRSDLATLDDLAEAQKEANGARAAFNGRGALKIGEAASYSELASLASSQALTQYGYILFATHGLLPGENCAVAEPSIVLAHPELPQAHGLLTASDITKMPFNANVVLLSACSTGAYLKPEDRPLGDGISQLARAFLSAGTRSAGVTLWDVYSEAGPKLVPAFFRAIRQGKTPAQALQQAKIAMINSPMRHPFFWAPTVLYGDAR